MLLQETEGMFNKRLFDMMKPRSFLVNTARGKIVNRTDVVDALESGHLQGGVSQSACACHHAGGH